MSQGDGGPGGAVFSSLMLTHLPTRPNAAGLALLVLCDWNGASTKVCALGTWAVPVAAL